MINFIIKVEGKTFEVQAFKGDSEPTKDEDYISEVLKNQIRNAAVIVGRTYKKAKITEHDRR